MWCEGVFAWVPLWVPISSCLPVFVPISSPRLLLFIRNGKITQRATGVRRVCVLQERGLLWSDPGGQDTLVVVCVCCLCCCWSVGGVLSIRQHMFAVCFLACDVIIRSRRTVCMGRQPKTHTPHTHTTQVVCCGCVPRWWRRGREWREEAERWRRFQRRLGLFSSCDHPITRERGKQCADL